jgi:hypothetical protein
METAKGNTFKVGDEVTARSMADYDCIFRFTILKRTAQFVTFQYFNDVKRAKIKIDRDGNEYFLPFGSYSMAAIVTAR